jgi:hypothetical protein
MIKLYNIYLQFKEFSAELKITIVAVTLVLTTCASLVSQCNENRRLREEIESRKNVQRLKADIEEIRDMSDRLTAPSLADIKEARNEDHNSSIDSDSPTF